MKIRVLSDLHVDVNEMYAAHRAIHLDDDVFTIIAGDTAGNVPDSINWIHQNVQKGLVIAGNHIVYAANRQPVQDLKQQLAQAFPQESPITFLDQMTGTMTKEVDNLLFIGTTLYTNYSLLSDVSVETAMGYALGRHGMNDFRFGYTRDQDQIRPLHPKDYLRWFIESQKEITRQVESHPDKEIVLITHHCPSGQCCSNNYDIINASYASNLEPFIREHPNIKLWICGHAHNRKNFKVGNCLVLMNPRGYEFEGECFDFNPNTFVETKDWSVHCDPLKKDPNAEKTWFKELLKRACFEL